MEFVFPFISEVSASFTPEVENRSMVSFSRSNFLAQKMKLLILVYSFTDFHFI